MNKRSLWLVAIIVVMSLPAVDRYSALAQSPQPRLLCDTAIPGEVVAVQGEGFAPGAGLTQLRWDDIVTVWSPAGLTVDGNGRFTLWFSAPSDTYALHTLVARDSEGWQGECYLNLTPRQPTPTWTSTATLTPTPTPTATPGLPPGITLTPTPVPGPGEVCTQIEAVFTRQPLAGSPVGVGLDIHNSHQAWPANRMQVGLWRYDGLSMTDTGVRVDLPALAGGANTTLTFSFIENQAGAHWYQLRLIDTVTGAISGCVSDWYHLDVRSAVPFPPALREPAAGNWQNTREIVLTWQAADVPTGAEAVEQYNVRLSDSSSNPIFNQMTAATSVAHFLTADYGTNQLSWQARARNSAGWGSWSSPFFFGVDTTSPVVDISVQGTPGDNGWIVSPLTVRVTGSDPTPGSDLSAAFVQPGPAKWQQVVPGADTLIDQEGEFSLRAYGRDGALNRSPVVVESVKIDRTAPEQVALNLSGWPTTSGWYTAPLTIDVIADDSVSGPDTTTLRVDGGDWQPLPLTLTANGPHSLEYLARDRAGNETAIRHSSAKLDLVRPSGTLELSGGLCRLCDPITVMVGVSDTESGVGHWTLSVEEPDAISETILDSGSSPGEVLLDGRNFPAGTLTLRLAVEDEAGWVTRFEMDVINGASEPGPTPIPITPSPTATLWPTPTSNRATPTVGPGATTTPEVDEPDDDSGSDDDDEDHGNGGNSAPPPGNYPVGGQVVPVLLPVTGAPSGNILLPVTLLIFSAGIRLVHYRRTIQKTRIVRSAQ